MQDIQVTRHSNFVGAPGLVVDPSVISALVKSNASKQGPSSRKSKMQNQKLQRNRVAIEPMTSQPFPCPMSFGAASEKTRPASEASDTTREPFDREFDSSDPESFNDSSSKDFSPNFERNEAQRGFRMPRSAKFSMPRQPGLQMDNTVRTKAATNSSPADFAAAFQQVASTGAWKREGKQHRGLGQRAAREQQKAMKASTGPKQETLEADDTKDMPLPKWFAPKEQSALPMPEPTGAVNMSAQDEALLAILTEMNATAQAEAARMQAPSHFNGNPVKICMPDGYECDTSVLNLGMPMKKCLPRWEL